MSEPDEHGPNATSDVLAGTSWEIVTIDGQPVGEGGARLQIRFGHDGRVTGSTGVNQMTASYGVTAEYLTFGPLATTRREGPPDLLEQEQRVLSAFAGMCPIRLDPTNLSFEGPLGRVELVSTRRPAPVSPGAPAEPVPVDRPTDPHR